MTKRYERLSWSKYSVPLMESSGVLLCSQEPTIGPADFSPCHISLRSILIVSYHLHPVFQSGLFLSGFLTKFLYIHLTTHATFTADLTICDSITLIIFCEEYKFEALHYVTSSILLLLPPSQTQMFSLALSS